MAIEKPKVEIITKKEEDIKSLCIALKAIWDKRIEKGEITITRDKKGRRIITIK